MVYPAIGTADPASGLLPIRRNLRCHLAIPLCARFTISAAQTVFDSLDTIGIDVSDVFLNLEDEGVEKFKDAWSKLLKATQEQFDGAATQLAKASKAP